MTENPGRRIGAGFGRRELLKSAGIAAAGGLAAPALIGQQRAKPNLLLILTDQQHIDTIAAGGNSRVRTPAMDWLARRGVSFRQSYCANPVCSPSRSSIFTGRMASETGVYDNGRSIREDIPNLGQWFSENSGYETVYAGKWHLPQAYTSSIPGFRVLPGGIGGQGNLGDTAVARACEGYLRNRGEGKPFLLVASLLQPHDICEWLRLNAEDRAELRYPGLRDELPPLPSNFEFDVSEPEDIRKLRAGNEAGEYEWQKLHWQYYLWSYHRHVEMVDGEIGRILQALRDSERDNDTVIVFTSDHGEGMACHQMVRKSSPYDESAKAPLLVSLPGETPASRIDADHLVSGLDIVPTLCDFAGITAPPKMRGRSLKPLLAETVSSLDRNVFVEIPADRGRVVRTPRYKYISFDGDKVDQLFDMEKDPGETKNLATSPAHSGAVEEHRKLLLEWERGLDVAPGLPSVNAWWRRA